MKNLTLILSSLLLLFAGCNRTNDYTSYEDLLLKVVSSDVNYPAAGGEGAIIIDHPKPVTAKSNMWWCSVSVNGQRISLNIAGNSDLIARQALVTITDGHQVNYVTVKQSAIRFFIETNRVNISSDGGEVRLRYEADDDISVTLSDTWLTCSIDQVQKQLVLDIPVYTNLNVERTASGTLTVGSGLNSFTAKISIVQEKKPIAYNEYLGTYTMNYATSNAQPPNRNRTATVVLVKATEGQTFHLKGILAPADEALGDIVVQYSRAKGIEFLGQIIFVRAVTNYSFWWNPYSTPANGNYVARSTTVGMVGTNYDLISGRLTFSLVDNGVWGDHTTAGFLLRNYDGSTSMGNVNGADGQAFVFYPIFTKQ